ncbi:hypothetical protein L1787_06030 [Acuticoccus sp. M5D2P5]|uniref:hypothetical protein n=1 Tax=Acuticoccus kalidii TaxID=2910977 RepID=UPI001F3BB3C1|nr:hypothetical protein [Acuticoccus kalidii]MCF3932972.1 hypothetical protein [Acuticoccus kalidii]
MTQNAPLTDALSSVMAARDIVQLIHMGADKLHEERCNEANAIQQAARMVLDLLDEATEEIVMRQSLDASTT